MLGAILFLTGAGNSYAATAPQIRSFEAASVDELAPGTELTFHVEGTPRSQAAVRVPGIRQPIRLTETRLGVYEGSYTIKRADRPPADAGARAVLRRQNVSVTSRLATPLATTTAAIAPTATIQRFAMEPGVIEPGTELTFS